jgi:hypothetical protein
MFASSAGRPAVECSNRHCYRIGIEAQGKPPHHAWRGVGSSVPGAAERRLKLRDALRPCRDDRGRRDLSISRLFLPERLHRLDSQPVPSRPKHREEAHDQHDAGDYGEESGSSSTGRRDHWNQCGRSERT